MFRSTLLKQQPAMLSRALRPALLMPATTAPAMPSMLRTQPLVTIPQPPGGIIGSVHDPVAVPPPSKVHGSLHWTFERLLLVGIVPLCVAPLVGGSLSPVLDGALGSLILVHSHLGFESCIIDYIPKRVYGVWHNVAISALFIGTGTALFGVYQMEKNDIGITKTIGKVWNA